MGIKTVHEAAIRNEDHIRYERIKKKGADFIVIGRFLDFGLEYY